MKLTTIILPLRIFGLEYESDDFFGFDFYELPGMIFKSGSWVFPFFPNTSGPTKNGNIRLKILKDNDIINLEELASGSSFEFMSRGFHSGDSQKMDQSLIDSLVGFQDDLTNLGLFALLTWAGFIDVGDGCWRRNVLVTTIRCWWRFWPFWSPKST